MGERQGRKSGGEVRCSASAVGGARARAVAKAIRVGRLGGSVPLVGPICPVGRVEVAGRVFGVGRDALGRWVLTSGYGVRYVLRRSYRAAGELLAVTAKAPGRCLPATFAVVPGPLGVEDLRVLS